MIETLKVQNYKSLKDIEIPLKPLTVLVGPNAAGKSNILDCLTFLAEVASSDFSRHFQRHGGFADITWGGKAGEAVSVSCTWRPKEPGGDSFSYALVAEHSPSRGGPVIMEELLSSGLPGGVSFKRTKDRIQIGRSFYRLPPDQSMLHGLSEPLVLMARQVMANWTFYDFVTQRMRDAQPVAKQTRLKPDGSNVGTLLHWIFSEERKLFNQVEEHLKAAIPEVDELMSRLTEDGKTYVAWRERYIPGQIPAWNMSEGSVRLAAIFLALLVPQPPPLIAFENPDVHLHAHLMQYLAEILKAGSRHSQVIITTHSPYLLDHIPPESVLIVWKEAGETKVKPVADTAELKEALKTLGLGELYYTGHLGGVP